MASPVQAPPVPSGEEGRSSSAETPTRAKRAQVKNACVNCQKACKKCDSGRPCLRCVKYNLVDSCADSKRKPRKKGIKRGPYKKRKKNLPDDDAASGTGTAGWSGPEQPGAPAQLPIARAAAVQIGGPSRAPPPVLSRTSSLRRARQSRIMGQRVQRQPPPPVLGPGAIPILHADPAYYDSEDSEDSSSDVPLLAQHTARTLSAVSYATQQYRPSLQQPAMYGIPPSTPTAGLATAFRSLAAPGHQPPTPIYRHHHRPPPPLSQTATAPIRLPPIESFDHAHALRSPPSTSSLAILTDVALGRTSEQPPAPLHPPLPLPLPPGRLGHRDYYSTPENTGQQSHDDRPPPTGRPQRTRSVGNSEPSSPDSSRTYIRRLSRRLRDTHLEQEHARP